jgi:hypothetical protein
MLLSYVSLMLMIASSTAAGNAHIARLCPCASAGTSWTIDSLDKPTLFKSSTNSTQALAIAPGPPSWGPEGSGCIVEDINPAPGLSDYQQWAVNSPQQQVLWPKNSSMCMTVLPPNPATSALVGIWFCGASGFKAAQSFKTVASGTNYQLQISGADGSPLCLSLPTTTC